MLEARPKFRLRRLLVAVGVVGATAAALATLHLGLVPASVLPWPDLRLDERPSVLVDWRLAALKHAPGTCKELMVGPEIDARPARSHLRRNGCGWFNAFRVRRVAGARLRPQAPVMRCEQAAALALWMRHDVQPAARRLLGSEVVGIRHFGTYKCRAIRGGRRIVKVPSQHSFANAIDIAGFQLADGRSISLIRHWRKGARGRFLRQIYADSCRWFRVKLGPASNRGHRDHFHFDRGWAASRCAGVVGS